MTTTPNKLLPLDPIGQEKMMWCWAACSQMVLNYLRSSSELHVRLARGLVAKSGVPAPGQGELCNMRRPLGHKPHVDCGKPPDKHATYAEEEEWYKVCNWGGFPNLMEFSPLVESSTWASHRFVLEKRGIQLQKEGPLLRVERALSDAELYRLAYQSGAALGEQLHLAESCALSWTTLKQQIDDGSPVIFSWRYRSGGAHLMVASGYLSIPGDKTNWVFVCDPWPPHSGDGYLIPYDYYVGGPHGRHWRDYWVPKTGTSPYMQPLEDAFAVTPESEATAGSDEKPQDPDSRATTQVRPRESPSLALSKAMPTAAKGLSALQAIVDGDDSLRMALALGMGVIWMKSVARTVADTVATHLGSAGEDLASSVNRESEALEANVRRYLGPPENKLTFFAEGELPIAIPVFEIRAEDLLAWDGGATKLPIPDAPTEFVFPVRWPGQEPFELFSTVTVRRGRGDSWQVVSIGRASVMQALGLRRWAQKRGLSEDPSWLVGKDGPSTLVEALKDLDLVSAATRQLRRVEWFVGLLEDLGLDKLAWRAAAKLKGLFDQETVAARIEGSSMDEDQKARAHAVAEEVARAKTLSAWRHLVSALIDGPDAESSVGPGGSVGDEKPTSASRPDAAAVSATDREVDDAKRREHLEALLVGPDLDSDDPGDSVLDELWLLLLKENSALDQRPAEPSEEDWQHVRKLARAVEKVLDYFMPLFQTKSIHEQIEKASVIEGVEKLEAEARKRLAGVDIRPGAALQEELEKLRLGARKTEQLDELAQATHDGWKLLGDLVGKAAGAAESEVKAKPRGRKAKTRLKLLREILDSKTPDAMLNALGSSGIESERALSVPELIQAVQAGWKHLDERGHDREPKPSLKGWNLPRYMIEVPELYQEFLVYADDEIIQAHPDFHRRPNQVRAKDKLDLLTQLRRLARA